MPIPRVFVKLGGSYITDKSVRDTLRSDRIQAAAEAILQAHDQGPLSLVLGHGAGSYGHILAEEFSAVQGIHPERGWEGLYRIRESMTEMNLAFVRACAAGGLFPVTVSPFATATAEGGVLARIETGTLEELLEKGQIPLIHGDVVLDSKQGFTIASTETLLEALSQKLPFDRIVMVSDTPGVLDASGATIERIDGASIGSLAGILKGSGKPDVTGGMQRKVEKLHALVSSGKAKEARLIGCSSGAHELRDAILGSGSGTLITS